MEGSTRCPRICPKGWNGSSFSQQSESPGLRSDRRNGNPIPCPTLRREYEETANANWLSQAKDNCCLSSMCARFSADSRGRANGAVDCSKTPSTPLVPPRLILSSRRAQAQRAKVGRQPSPAENRRCTAGLRRGTRHFPAGAAHRCFLAPVRLLRL